MCVYESLCSCRAFFYSALYSALHPTFDPIPSIVIEIVCSTNSSSGMSTPASPPSISSRFGGIGPVRGVVSLLHDILLLASLSSELLLAVICSCLLCCCLSSSYFSGNFRNEWNGSKIQLLSAGALNLSSRRGRDLGEY
jgi:hypothetical protein